MDCSLPGSSVHGILQARILLEWVAMSSSRVSSWSRDLTHASCITSRFLMLSQCGSPRIFLKGTQNCTVGSWGWGSLVITFTMAPHSSALAWKIPWTEEPGRLQSMGSLRVRQDWATSLSPFAFMHWRRKWQPTPVFLPGESQGRGSLVGFRLWGHTESDTTEAT